MAGSIVIITDKVMRMTRSMVYLAMRFAPFQGATVADVTEYLNDRVAGGLHQGLVERVLEELRHDGVVARRSDRWYLAGAQA